MKSGVFYITILMLVTCLFLGVFVAPANADTVLNTYDTYYGQWQSNGKWSGFSFYVDDPLTLNSITFQKLGRWGTEQSTSGLVIQIEETTDMVPNKTVLETVNISAASINAWENVGEDCTAQTIEFDGTTFLDGDTWYAFVWHSNDTINQHYMIPPTGPHSQIRGYTGDSEDEETNTYTYNSTQVPAVIITGTGDQTGNQTYTFETLDSDNAWLDSGNDSSWLDCASATADDVTADGTLQIGYTEHVNLLGQHTYNIYEGIMGFDIGELPEGEIVSANLSVWLTSKINETGVNDMYGIYAGSIVDGVIDDVDFNSVYSPPRGDRISSLHNHNTMMTGEYQDFELIPSLVEADANGYIWCYLMSTYHYLGIKPANGTGTNQDHDDYVVFEGSDADNTHEPILTITLKAEPEESEEVGGTNSSKITEIENGTVTSIEWETPRCAYSSESLNFDVTGTPGSPLLLKLVTEDGTVLATVDDSIRDDGIITGPQRSRLLLMISCGAPTMRSRAVNQYGVT